jgi:fructose-bisphosphate aldolase, class I
MNVRFKLQLPWTLAFSFALAILQPALEIWPGKEAIVPAAQKALYYRARCNRATCQLKHDSSTNTPIWRYRKFKELLHG